MNAADELCLYVSVPVACFRAPYARMFAQSLSVPPPATVYGMLLSLIGEKDREKHVGVRIAIALLSTPESSTVLRMMWRIKKTKIPQGTGENKSPDYQELLTGIDIAVWIRAGSDKNTPTLAGRVRTALSSPDTVKRYGALSLGESTHLVDDLRFMKKKDQKPMRLLKPVREGDFALPIWVDHVGSYKTIWRQFILADEQDYFEPGSNDFVEILSN